MSYSNSLFRKGTHGDSDEKVSCLLRNSPGVMSHCFPENNQDNKESLSGQRRPPHCLNADVIGREEHIKQTI